MSSWEILYDGKPFKRQGRASTFNGIDKESTALANARWIVHCSDKSLNSQLVSVKFVDPKEKENICLCCGQKKPKHKY